MKILALGCRVFFFFFFVSNFELEQGLYAFLVEKQNKTKLQRYHGGISTSSTAKKKGTGYRNSKNM